MAIAGRATERIELGTAVLQTYPCHPLLQANRVASVTKAMGRPGLTLGIGPSHEEVVRDVYGLDYASPGANTEEYVRILVRLLRGETVDVDGDHWTVHSAGRMVPPDHRVPVLVSALGPRLLRVAGEVADGTVLWLATARVIGEHVAPIINGAADAAGRPAPRIVAGLPVAVHDDVEEARAAQAQVAALYASRPNFRRIVELGGADSAAETAIVGDETSVTAQLQSLLDAGATDIHAAIFPVGDDPKASIRRTRQLLAGLCD
jgi:F420-dependent oxidoreductase-like protein